MKLFVAPASVLTALPVFLNSAVGSAQPANPACFTENNTFHEKNIEGPELYHFLADTANECAASCCNRSTTCCGYTWTAAQPHAAENCGRGSKCCWLKGGNTQGTCEAVTTEPCGSGEGNCTSGTNSAFKPSPTPPAINFFRPKLAYVSTIARDMTGNLRDPASMVQDPITKRWHFWTDYIPGATQPGWHAFQHHYSSDSIFGPWTNQGLAFNHSSDPNAWDAAGQLSSSVLFAADEELWYFFYTAAGNNQSTLLTTANLVRTSKSPDGPWSEPSVVGEPTGHPPDWNGTWNARRLDSGRGLVVGGTKGFWTKGVSLTATACEGLYLPRDSSSFAPPYDEYAHNPLYGPTPQDPEGYENCEFFRAPPPPEGDDLLHVVCSYHGGVKGSPHFVVNLTESPQGRNWTLVESMEWTPAKSGDPLPGEPTPVYEGGPPGDQATVQHFIARVNLGKNAGALGIGLFNLTWEKAF